VIWNQPLSENDEKQSYFTLHTDSGLLTTSRAVLFVAALCNRAGHYGFMMWFVLLILILLLFLFLA